MENIIPTITDIPTTRVSVKLGSLYHEVLDELGSSEKLVEIETLIDETARTSRWLASPNHVKN